MVKLEIEFCYKCGKPKNYTGRDKHLVSCCKCEEDAIKEAKIQKKRKYDNEKHQSGAFQLKEGLK